MNDEDRMKQMEKKISKLEDRCEELSRLISLIVIAKMKNQNFAYHNWLLEFGVSEKEEMLLNILMGVLNLRLDGKKIDQEFKKQLPNIANDELYKDAPPTFEEVLDLVTRLFSDNEFSVFSRHVKNRLILLLKAMYIEGKFSKLSEFLLIDANEELPIIPD